MSSLPAETLRARYQFRAFCSSNYLEPLCLIWWSAGRGSLISLPSKNDYFLPLCLKWRWNVKSLWHSFAYQAVVVATSSWWVTCFRKTSNSGDAVCNNHLFCVWIAFFRDMPIPSDTLDGCNLQVLPGNISWTASNVKDQVLVFISKERKDAQTQVWSGKAIH